eukprot:g62410.t1
MEGTATEETTKFLNQLNESFPGLNWPRFYRGPYTGAVSFANSQGQLLLVYLHCQHHDDTERFLRNTLCTDEFTAFATERNLCLW